MLQVSLFSWYNRVVQTQENFPHHANFWLGRKNGGWVGQCFKSGKVLTQGSCIARTRVPGGLRGWMLKQGWNEQNLWQGTQRAATYEQVRTLCEGGLGGRVSYERHVGEDWRRGPRTAAWALCCALPGWRVGGVAEAILSLLKALCSALHCCTAVPLFPPLLCASQAANAAADALNAETLLLPPVLALHWMAGSLLNRFVTLFICQPLKPKGVSVLTLLCSLYPSFSGNHWLYQKLIVSVFCPSCQ